MAAMHIACKLPIKITEEEEEEEEVEVEVKANDQRVLPFKPSESIVY